jgi:hypothetical protein
MTLTKINFLIGLVLISFSSYAQTETKNQKMIATTKQLIISLKNCDTSRFLHLLDTAFAHTNKANYRTYIKESFLEDCSLFNEIVARHELPDINDIIFKKDSSQLPAANIAMFPIVSTEDTTLNIKKCFLLLIFYPDEYFAINSHLLKYTLVVERIKTIKTDKVEMPGWLKKSGKN